MSRKSNRRRKRFSGHPLQVRMPAELLEKIEWSAAQRGQSRPEFARSVLTKAARSAVPSNGVLPRAIPGTPEQWALWREAADKLGMPLETYVLEALNAFSSMLDAGVEQATLEAAVGRLKSLAEAS